jgi:hypothetical protein
MPTFPYGVFVLDAHAITVRKICKYHLFRSYGSANFPLTKAQADESPMNFWRSHPSLGVC